MSRLSWADLVVVLFGLFSSFIKETLRLGEAPVATVVGIVIGPHALNLFNPYDWGGKDNEEVTNEITLEVTRVVIALSVFAVGVELPKVLSLLLGNVKVRADSRHTYGDIGVHSSFCLDHVWCGDGWSLLFSFGDYYQDIISSLRSSLPLVLRLPIRFSLKQLLEESLRKNTSRHMFDICWLPSRDVMTERLFRSCTLPFISCWMLVQDMPLENGSTTLCESPAWLRKAS